MSSISPRAPAQAHFDSGSHAYSHNAGVKLQYPGQPSIHLPIPRHSPPVEDFENKARKNTSGLNNTQAYSPSQLQQPGNRRSSYVVNIPSTKRTPLSEHRKATPYHGTVGSREEDTEDVSSDSAAEVDVSLTKPSEATHLPPVQTIYNVPNNTPAGSNHLPQPGPRYIVQLPSSYLQQRTGLPLSNDQGDTEVPSTAAPPYEHAIPAPQFQMPPPSLFKAAPRSAPLSIRPPPPDEHLPKICTDTAPLIDIEKSPASSVMSQDTGTPGTTGGPFTPFIGSGTFSPAQSRSFGDAAVGKNEDGHPRGDLSVRFVDVE